MAPVASTTQIAATATTTFQFGKGSIQPEKFDNRGFFALFALLGAAMVLAAIWFFFWAKNGGFVWRKGDWDDYKSTVLRRKGPDGRTLTNATPVTNLGQKSIAGTFDNERREEMSEVGHYERKSAHTKRPTQHGKREHSDEDVRAYREEKPARVGGLNRQHDGSHFDFSEYSSDVVSNNSRVQLNPKDKESPPKKKGFLEKTKEKRNEKKKASKDGVKKAEQPVRRSPAQAKRPSHRPASVTTADDLSTLADDTERNRAGRDSYANMYRRDAPTHPSRFESPRRHQSPRHSQQHAPNAARQPSPRKQNRPPGSFDAYSDAGSSDTGTRSYVHHIPELSRGSRDTGFRRGGGKGGRRDSLSDSD